VQASRAEYEAIFRKIEGETAQLYWSPGETRLTIPRFQLETTCPDRNESCGADTAAVHALDTDRTSGRNNSISELGFETASSWRSEPHCESVAVQTSTSERQATENVGIQVDVPSLQAEVRPSQKGEPLQRAAEHEPEVEEAAFDSNLSALSIGSALSDDSIHSISFCQPFDVPGPSITAEHREGAVATVSDAVLNNEEEDHAQEQRGPEEPDASVLDLSLSDLPQLTVPEDDEIPSNATLLSQSQHGSGAEASSTMNAEHLHDSPSQISQETTAVGDEAQHSPALPVASAEGVERRRKVLEEELAWARSALESRKRYLRERRGKQGACLGSQPATHSTPPRPALGSDP
jgi:hypothetical protein